MSKKIAIIDYQLGNLFSVQQACLYVGANAEITMDKKKIMGADYVILPGVGAFGDAMENLRAFDLINPIKDVIALGKPFMGVCLGLQLLFTESEELGNHKGLNIIEGITKKFSPNDTDGSVLKVPQISWNQICPSGTAGWSGTPLQNCNSGDYMYFVHSYYVAPASVNDILSVTLYGGYQYCSSIKRQNIFACQFHPEKSGNVGLQIYKNFFNL